MKWRMRKTLVIVELKVIWKKIVFGKLFDFSRDGVFIVLTVLIKKMFDTLL